MHDRLPVLRSPRPILDTAGELVDVSARPGPERRTPRVRLQPIVSFENGDLLAAEAFLRPREPGGLLGAAGGELLRLSSELLRGDGALAPARIHINLDRADFGSGRSPASRLRRAAERHGIPFGRLCVEVGARQADRHPDDIVRLRRLGVSVGVEDVGSEVRSSSLLRRLPVTDVKLSPSLTRSLADGRRARTVTAHLADLGRDLGLRVVAEGVRTGGQLRALREIGVRAGQGRLLGPPRPPAYVRARGGTEASPLRPRPPVRWVQDPAGTAVVR